jgi:hypothetical protein
VRASKGFAVFRIIFGLLFLWLGFDQYSRYPATSQLPYFTLAIGALFVGYGLWALFAKRSLGSNIELETETPSATDRLAEITRLKTSGLITEQEFEAKRQEILKDL